LALDEPKDNDEVFDINGLTFLMEKSLRKYLNGIEIDFNDSGFRPGFSITPQWAEQKLATGTCSI
jgi:Fe-S cluster assembly iron-binding protein IscA